MESHCIKMTEKVEGMPQPLEAEGSPIQQFYQDKCVLITGGTGFLGKVLTEKLLRSCSGVSQIFLIARPKKGKTIHERIDDIFSDPLFAKIPAKARLKVEAIEGDCAVPGLGLSDQDRCLLVSKVHIIIHAAATVRFDERLSIAVDINVRGTREMLDLAREMPGLKAFVHVSTAFANCHLQQIEEKFYPPPTSCENLSQLTQCVQPDLLDQITPQILDKWPNTYVYTKSVAEDLVLRYSKGLPVAVFRPAVVVATNSEPIPGWIDNLYGATGVVVGCGTGVLRTLQCDSSVSAQIVPVDMSCSAIIAATWHVANRSNKDSNQNISKEEPMVPPIFNYVPSAERPITWADFMSLSYTHGLQVPPLQTMWYICLTLHTSWFMNKLFVVLFHFLPAIIIDLIAMLFGKRTNLLKIYKKINKFSDVIAYFGTRTWDFKNTNTQALWQSLEAKDQQLFFFDMSQLDWNKYFYWYTRGVRQYLLKDDLSTVPQAQKRLRRFYWAHQGLKMLFAYFSINIIWSVTSMLLTMT
ncbi:fatty acyl-CoA reductase wat-like isoform X2 [Homalodisca vitripennis]|uniref:fatty acyl-CoA reductase wat-like isoform X2 n=1 Tax=Homalodisca vitripennis TaxID=197043 RepID=UPI001EEC1ACD|nr:fatty acyl-CoA reductase wat-like isoform X2 [Homalodisca vitripennis]